ncbi:MAG: hypothetical protein EP343_09260 [Deltaproteobacteria bacterium]|nr:MAG: hypothetical protein EP343_09260 [Deltaproteobacteria bacterium]
MVCGYSDVTSLHLSILKYAGLKTLYGPALMTWFGEHPDGVEESTQSFLNATMNNCNEPRVIEPFKRWSNHSRSWSNGDWKNIPREWKENKGWNVVNPGSVEGEIVVANLNTLMSSAGTGYFPELEGKILLIEEMSAPWSQEERSLRQLQLMGVFDVIAGLVVGKVEVPNQQGAPFGLDELVSEVLGQRTFPVISEFDCSHTLPMHTMGERCLVSIEARTDCNVTFTILDSFVE